MLRKSTIIILIIFIIALGIVIYDHRSTDGLFKGTATPTSNPKFITEWSPDDAVQIEIRSEDIEIAIVKDSTGVWTFVNNAQAVDQNKVFEFLTTLAVLDTKAVLDGTIPLESLGLDDPVYKISMSDKNQSEVDISIGNLTPTSSGYYVILNNNNPSVISKTSLDVLIGAFTSNALVLVTPTPTDSLLSTPASP